MTYKVILSKSIFTIINIILFLYFVIFAKVNFISIFKINVITVLILISLLSIFLPIYYNKIKDNEKITDILDITSFVSNTVSFLLILTTLILFNARVVGSSMSPTLVENDFVIAKRFNLNLEKEDIVIYYNDDYIIKRVFAIEDDIIEIRNNYLYVNNKILVDKNNENYYLTNSTNLYIMLSEYNFKYTLKKDELILLGDNATNSTDSRQKGIIYNNEIIGKVLRWF